MNVLSTLAKIQGGESKVAIIQLHLVECLRVEKGAMLFMTQGIETNT